MTDAIVLAVTSLIAMTFGTVIGWHACRARSAVWYVRPHTESTAARMPLPEQGAPTDTLVVSTPRWQRGKMD